MTLDELRSQCQTAQQSAFGTNTITLILRGRWGDRKTALLAGRGSPKGVILSDAFNGRTGIVVQFKASEILAWLDKKQQQAEKETTNGR